MYTIKRVFIMSALVVGVLSNYLCAKVRSVGSQREFEQNVAHKGICVALFYKADDKKDVTMQKKNKQLQRMVEDVSAQQSYDDADVVFIKINSACKEFDTIVNNYDVMSVPCFLLFDNGRQVMNGQNKPAVLHGFIVREELETFINNYCGKEINTLNNAKEATQKNRMDEEKESWLPYFYPRDIFVRDYDPAQRSME